ncbi:MAG TPA: hypothetical protein HA362_01600 [Nanoarchaeota archaeon]|nr:hypothetical protein [Nanoarchaeota archaeon]
MEMPEWVTYAIIVLAVILVIGLVLVKFYPETWSEISGVAEEVFQIGIEKKQDEAAIEVMDGTIQSIVACITNAVESCGCRIDTSTLPKGYSIVMQNRVEEGGKKYILLNAIRQEDFVGTGQKIKDISLRLAVAGSVTANGAEIKGIACRELLPKNVSKEDDTDYENLIIRNDNGNIRITAGNEGPFAFYDESISLQLFKTGNNACLITNAVEAVTHSYSAFGDGTDSAPYWISLYKKKPVAAFFPEITETLGEIPGMRERREAAQEKEALFGQISRLPLCSGTAIGGIAAGYGTPWPIASDAIVGLALCAGKYKQGDAEGTEIRINAAPGTDISVPLHAGVVTDYCTENCGDEGKSITIYEVFNHEANWPTGRLIRLTGLSEIKAGMAKGEVKVEHRDVLGIGGVWTVSGTNVSEGETIGKAGNTIGFIEAYERMPGNIYRIEWGSRTPDNGIIREALIPGNIKGRFCMLPRLAEEKYSGEGCEAIQKFVKESCMSLAEELAGDTHSLDYLREQIAGLKDGEHKEIMLDFQGHNFLMGLKKGQSEFGDNWWKCRGGDALGEAGTISRPGGSYPSECYSNDVPCICLAGSRLESLSKGNCRALWPIGFQPVFMKSGGECNDNDDNFGPLVYSGGGYSKVIIQRSGKILGMCSSFPCI